MYGLRDTSFGPPGIIGAIEATPAGNVALRIGNPNPPEVGGWTQTEYVVLSLADTREVVNELLAHLGEDLLPPEPTTSRADAIRAAWQQYPEATDTGAQE